MWSCSHWSHVFHEDFKEQGKHGLYPTFCKLHNWVILFKINQSWYNSDLLEFDSKTSENLYSWAWHHLSLYFSGVLLKSIGHFKCSVATGICCLHVSKLLHDFLNLNFTGLMIQADFSSSRTLTSITPLSTFQPNGVSTEDPNAKSIMSREINFQMQVKKSITEPCSTHTQYLFLCVSLQDLDKNKCV